MKKASGYGVRKDGKPKRKPGPKPKRKSQPKMRSKTPVDEAENSISGNTTPNSPDMPDPGVNTVAITPVSTPPDAAQSPFGDTPLPPPAARGGFKLVNEPDPEPELDDDQDEETDAGPRTMGRAQAALLVDAIFAARDTLFPVVGKIALGFMGQQVSDFTREMHEALDTAEQLSDADKAVYRPLLVTRLAKIEMTEDDALIMAVLTIESSHFIAMFSLGAQFNAQIMSGQVPMTQQNTGKTINQDGSPV